MIKRQKNITKTTNTKKTTTDKETKTTDKETKTINKKETTTDKVIEKKQIKENETLSVSDLPKEKRKEYFDDIKKLKKDEMLLSSKYTPLSTQTIYSAQNEVQNDDDNVLYHNVFNPYFQKFAINDEYLFEYNEVEIEKLYKAGLIEPHNLGRGIDELLPVFNDERRSNKSVKSKNVEEFMKNNIQIKNELATMKQIITKIKGVLTLITLNNQATMKQVKIKHQ